MTTEQENKALSLGILPNLRDWVKSQIENAKGIVSSIGGKVGDVTLADLNLDKVDNTPDAEKSVKHADTASAITGITFAPNTANDHIIAMYDSADAITTLKGITYTVNSDGEHIDCQFKVSE